LLAGRIHSILRTPHVLKELDVFVEKTYLFASLIPITYGHVKVKDYEIKYRGLSHELLV